jgi:hypothetical protein
MRKRFKVLLIFWLFFFVLDTLNGQGTVIIKKESLEKISEIISKVRQERIDNAIKFKELENEYFEFKKSNNNLKNDLELATNRRIQLEKRNKIIEVLVKEYKNSLEESKAQITILKEQFKELKDDFEKEKNLNDQLQLQIDAKNHALVLMKNTDSLAYSSLLEENTIYKNKLENFYSKFDENQIEVEGVQKDLKKLGIIKINTVQDGEVLTMNNEKEINYKALEFFQVSTGSNFNLSGKALKYDLFYIEEGLTTILVEDEMLWRGKNEKKIVFKKKVDFSDYRKGFFIFKVYYESDEKKIDYIKREFSIKEFKKKK